MDIFGCEENSRQMVSHPILPPPSTSSTSSSIGVHLRVTGHCSQGGRKYMEDFFSVAYHESKNTKNLEYAFVGIYDGHGGNEAATFAKEHLMMEIINQKLFWSDCDQDVLNAVREGYIATHYAMWREQEKWPKTATGLPSTAGTTATVAFIRHEKIYIGHVGDSGIVLGYQNSNESFWRAKQLTLDHKPENAVEKVRIMNSGGKVAIKSGVPRVVWNRPKSGHKGPVRRSTPIDEIPFLAVARSLGDLWSYNSELNKFIVSPDPDVKVIKINPETFRCLIFGTDGLWNVVKPQDAVDTVNEKEIINESINNPSSDKNIWYNHSKILVEKALKIWSSKKMRADNTSVVTVILYPPKNSSLNMGSLNNLTSSHVFERLQMKGEVNLGKDNVRNYSQKWHRNPNCCIKHRLYDIDSQDQTHQLQNYEAVGTSTIMCQYFQMYSPIQNMYNQNYFCREDNKFEINYDREYLNYDDQVSNNNVNSFTESYNTLLTPILEREDNNRFNNYNGAIDIERNETNPCKYHSYNSLNHTGLAGQDRVHHHYPNNEHRMEQKLYQEQCMSAVEGYCLTKLETRVEQQLRGNTIKEKNSLTSVQSMQIINRETNKVDEESYLQYNTTSNNFQKELSSSLKSNFWSSYEDNERYERNSDVTKLEEPLFVGSDIVIRTNSLCIERVDAMELERVTSESVQKITMPNSATEEDIKKVKNDDFEELISDEIIQIHEPCTLKTSFSPSQPRSYQNHASKTLPISHENIDSTLPINVSFPKQNLYANVPNENNRSTSLLPMHQFPRTFEKRILRSMTVDYSKRTLRSRNTLSNDSKSKNSATTNLRKSMALQNKCVKTSSLNIENSSSVTSKKCLKLRSREITTSAFFSESNGMSLPPSSSKQKLQRKSKMISFYDTSDLSNQLLATANRNDYNSTFTLHRKTVEMNASLPSHHLQVSISFAKRSSLKNNGWSSGKIPMQTRNRVQKRISR